MSMSRVIAVAIAAWIVGLAGAARADAIDGNWCRGDGSRFTIEGPAIVTPAGTHTTGSYHRHYFSYVVPAGEAGAGSTINMVLENENTVELSPGESAPPQTWLRCGPAVSLLDRTAGRNTQAS